MSDIVQIENRPLVTPCPRTATVTKGGARCVGAGFARWACVLLAPAIVLATVAFITAASAQSTQPVNRAGQQVTGENYTGANLSGANFSNATISGSSFIGANLANANFSGATITSSGGIPTSFGGANLSNTNFTGAKFVAANIQYSTLSCTNFTNSDMSGVVAGAVLTGLSTSCAPVFTGATVNCGIAQFSSQLNLSGATVPPNCQTPKALANAAAAGAPAWQCAGVAPSGYASWTYANAAGGSDSNACTASAPCASVKAALAACPAGQSCGALIYFGQYIASQTVTVASNQALIGACLATITNTDGTVYPAVLSADAVTVTKGDGSTFPMPFSESENLDMGIVGLASIQAFYNAGITLSQQAVAAGNGLYVSPDDCESDLCIGVVPQSITAALATVFVTMEAGTEVISIVTNTVQALDTVWLISDPEADRTYQIEVSADDDTKLNAIELSPFAHLHVAGTQAAAIIDYHPNDLASLSTATKASDEQYLDLATEMKGYMYVLGYTGSGGQVGDYFLDIYDPPGNFLSRTPDTSIEPAATGVNVGRIAIDMWRNMYGLGFEAIAGPGGRVEPSVSLWTPTTPDGGSGAT